MFHKVLDEILVARRCNWILVTFLVILTFSIASCGTTQITIAVIPSNTPLALNPATIYSPSVTYVATSSVSTISYKEEELKWLKGNPCQPPCWENIKPGQTTLQEVKEKLKQNNLVQNIQEVAYQDRGQLSWDWIGTDRGGTISYHAASTKQVTIIGPGFSTIKFQDILDAYGEPNYVQAEVNQPNEKGQAVSYHIFVLYSQKGFALAEGGNVKPSLDSNLQLEGLRFFVPNSLEEILPILSVGTSKTMVLWQGFKNFDFYCRQLDGNVCTNKS